MTIVFVILEQIKNIGPNLAIIDRFETDERVNRLNPTMSEKTVWKK